MAVGIGLGISRFPFDDAAGYWAWIEQCENGGIDSIWQTDRLVTKEPMLECFAAMALIAGATKKLRFGMNVASIALRDPLLVARQCATIDMLSGGRLLPAFGLGSALSQDYIASGTPTRGRGKRANEALEIVNRLWHEDDVNFEGEFFHYSSVSISPKPHNKRLPCWIGGSSEVAMKRTAKYGTGWLGGIDTPKQAGVMVRGIKAALVETGRHIDEDHYGATFSFRIGSADHAIVKKTAAGLEARLNQSSKDYIIAGDAAAVQGRIQQFLDEGCSKFVLIPMADGTKDVLQQTQLIIDEVLPTFT